MSAAPMHAGWSRQVGPSAAIAGRSTQFCAGPASAIRSVSPTTQTTQELEPPTHFADE